MNETMLILANWIVCAAGGWLCLCRMTKMSGRGTKLAIRWQYTILFTIFFASGWSWIFGDPATFIQMFRAGLLVIYVAAGMPAWRHGQPEYARR